MRYAILACLIGFLFSTCANATMDKQTDWWDLKKHWDTCATKDHELDQEFMMRSEEYYYSVPHKTPISKVAVLPPPASDKFTLNSLMYLEKFVLFNTEEMQSEFRITKHWVTDKGFKKSYEILKSSNLYDKYLAWVDEFISYRSIDKDLFIKMADALGTDTFLLVVIGYNRPGTAGSRLQVELYSSQIGGLNFYIINAREGTILFEYATLLGELQYYEISQFKGIYRNIYKLTPVE